ncbi:MAG: hypothetical protein QOI55_526 [Actinomycetota bacterium]|nr:hypothetical protein [Actinomycetota bacterium]
MGTDPVRVERADVVRIIRLDGATNLFDEAFVASFHGALDEIEAEGTGQAVVTTGAGKYFSNGFDLDYFARLDLDGIGDFVDRSCRLLARILTFPAPTVAVVNGHAFGIGGILALAHDQRTMRTDRGWFCLPEIDLGLAFHPFMLALITARLPAETANEAILTGRRYDGSAALERGIVHAIAAEDGLLASAIALADAWTGKRPGTVGALKAQLHAGVVATLDG